FSDAMCNVSRYVAVLESNPSDPASRHLAWSQYYGFHSNSFLNGTSTVIRTGDFSNMCIRRFSDSRSLMDSEPVIVFDLFKQLQGVSTCAAEQQAGGDTWVNCLNSNRASRGSWGVQVLRERDGALLSSVDQTFIWGRSDKILPSGDVVYLSEILPSDVR